MKKVGMLFALFAGLALFVYFYEIQGEEAREQAQEREESLLRIEEDEITGMTIERGEDAPVELTRNESSWNLVAPIETGVDRFVVDGLARELAGAKRDRTLEDAGAKASEYGLESPRLRLRVGLEAGDRFLRIGNDDYSGSKVYAQIEGSEDVHLIAKGLLTSADKELMEWRNKSVLEFEQEKAQVVEVVQGSETIRVEQREKKWFLTQPLQEQADSSFVSSLLSGIKYARAEKFLDDVGQDLKPYGLDQPRLVLRIQQEGDENWRVLEIGGADEETITARDASRELVFEIKPSVIEKLEEPVWDYRYKQIVDLEQEDVDRVQIRGKEEISIQREGEDFTIHEPEAQRGQKTAVYKFWYPLSEIKFAAIDDAPSASDDPRFLQPSIAIDITLKDGTVRQLQFSQQDEQYFARLLESGRSGRITKEDFEKLQLEAANLTI